ncbi:cytochrome P450 [Truncatella angustata]|uniref:Cytochrome P450 n=1 Tax=Truncatella angustata TaxID=152316 RepID=A0A9P8UYE1_9PEZI|nr:cytochrome P450 [Truncatella angustata]KAH6660209.1 cytochrome P450 [Truncatella angustata]
MRSISRGFRSNTYNYGASFSYFWITSRVLCKRYGSSLVRIGPNDLTTDNPDVIRMISSAKSIYRMGEANTGNRFNPYNETMFEILEPERHDQMKAKVAAAYSGRDTPGLESNVDEQIKSLIHLIRRKCIYRAVDSRTLSIGRISGLFALDVISSVSLGTAFGCLQNDADIHGVFFSTLHVHIPFMSVAVDVPWLRRLFCSDMFLRLMGPKETDAYSIDIYLLHARISDDLLIETYEGLFIRHGLSQADCESEALLMFIARSDTTASVIRITMPHVLSSQQVYQKLKEEIKRAVTDGKISSTITNAEARALPYLQAVIYESLRIRPVVSDLVFKEVPANDGTAIGTNLPSFLLNEDIFEEDSHIFRPERFMKLNSTTLSEMCRNVELQFGYGRWMCAGKPLAQMELNKLPFELFRNFDFQLVDPQNPMSSKSFVLWVDDGLEVRVTESDSGV